MLNVVADLSHYNVNPEAANGELNFEQGFQSGLRAVIHKATEGEYFHDPQYVTRKAQAQRAGLLWGAYHFGANGDGAAQAAHFLLHAGTDPHVLLVLDFEQNATGGLAMTTAQAEQFVQHVYQRTGRYPGLYSDPAYLLLTHAHLSPVLRQCWLWIASYEQREEPPQIPGWLKWKLWQYTDGKQGHLPHQVPGLGTCDRDQFNGLFSDLRQLWGYAPKPAPIVADEPGPASASGAGAPGKPMLAGVLPAPTLKLETLRFGAKLLAGLPITAAVQRLLVNQVATIRQAAERLMADKQFLVLLGLVVAGCYMARFVAALVGKIVATVPED